MGTRVEFLIAWDDSTWTTETHTVPQGYPKRFREWAEETLVPLTRYRKAVLFAVYAINPEEADAPCSHEYGTRGGICESCGAEV